MKYKVFRASSCQAVKAAENVTLKLSKDTRHRLKNIFQYLNLKGTQVILSCLSPSTLLYSPLLPTLRLYGFPCFHLSQSTMKINLQKLEIVASKLHDMALCSTRRVGKKCRKCSDRCQNQTSVELSVSSSKGNFRISFMCFWFTPLQINRQEEKLRLTMTTQVCVFVSELNAELDQQSDIIFCFYSMKLSSDTTCRFGYTFVFWSCTVQQRHPVVNLLIVFILLKMVAKRCATSLLMYICCFLLFSLTWPFLPAVMISPLTLMHRL